MFAGACHTGSTQGYEQIYSHDSVDEIIQDGLLRPENVISTRETCTFLSSPLIFWLSGGYKVTTHARCVLIVITCEPLAWGLHWHCTLNAIMARIMAVWKSELMTVFNCTLLLRIVCEATHLVKKNPRQNCYFRASRHILNMFLFSICRETKAVPVAKKKKKRN